VYECRSSAIVAKVTACMLQAALQRRLRLTTPISGGHQNWRAVSAFAFARWYTWVVAEQYEPLSCHVLASRSFCSIDCTFSVSNDRSLRFLMSPPAYQEHGSCARAHISQYKLKISTILHWTEKLSGRSRARQQRVVHCKQKKPEI
jgi:hypothetical protein